MMQTKTVSLLSKAVATAKTQKRSLASVSKPFTAPKASFRNQKQVFNNALKCKNNFASQKSEIRRFYASLPQGISEVKMPALSPTMTQGNLVQWKVKVGDKVTAGDVLCSVETDKATLDFENQSDAYIAKIIVPEGTKEVQLGTVIALFASKPEFIKNADQYNASAASAPAKAETQAAPQQPAQAPQPTKPAAAAAAALPTGATVLKMPALSPSPDMTEATLVEWKVKIGDKVVPGDVLGGVQTDKAVVDFENQAEGFVAKLLIQNGTRVPLGTPVAVLVKRKEDIDKVASYTGESAPVAPAQQSAPQQVPTTSAPAQTTSSPASQGGRVVASPLAKKIASEQGVNLSQISEGTGPNNRIIKQDVERFIAQRSAQPSVQQVQQTPSAQVQQQAAPSTPVAAAPAGAEYVDIPVSNVRRVIANRLLESKRNIPHYYLTIECEVDALLKVRSQLNKLGETRGYKLSVNDFVVKAASAALKKVPEANSSWQGDYIRQYKSADISVAVQTDNGLITPIVWSADKKGVAEISDQVKSLAQKAKQGKLQPQEFQGGSFTISNLGMFGITEFAAIINPPQACILAVGAADKKVVPNEGPDAKENPYKVVTVMKVTLSCDHRVVDGAVGAQWLQAFKEHIENPLMLML